eukprot:gene33772-43641_t
MHIYSALDTTNKSVDKTTSNKNHRHHRQLNQHGKWESSVFDEKLKSRSHLKEVDGLLNSQVTVVITSTAVRTNEYLRSRIVPSIRTWMKDFVNVYVIIEDTTEVRFDFRHCKFFDSPHFTSFSCPNEIKYILTRKCTSDYYIGKGICCKNDDAINFLVEHPNLFSHSQFVIVGDDDVYFRGDQMLRWLAAVARSGINHLPIVANSRPSNHFSAVSHIQKLRNGENAAVKKISAGTAQYGMSETCTEFDVSQDAGLGIFFWLYELYHIQIPNPTESVVDKHELTPTDLYKHGVKHRSSIIPGRHGHEDECNPEVAAWPAKDR